MEQTTVGDILALRLEAAEQAIDRALIETAALMAALPQARNDAYLSALAGQKAFEGVAAGVAALAEARRGVVQAHRVLGDLARRLGVETTAVGPVDKPADRPSRRRKTAPSETIRTPVPPG
jgi:hypothetical protein